MGRVQSDDLVQLEAFLHRAGMLGLADDLFVKDHWVGEVYVARAAVGGEIAGVLEGKIECGEQWPGLPEVCRVFNLLVDPPFGVEEPAQRSWRVSLRVLVVTRWCSRSTYLSHANVESRSSGTAVCPGSMKTTTSWELTLSWCDGR